MTVRRKKKKSKQFFLMDKKVTTSNPICKIREITSSVKEKGNFAVLFKMLIWLLIHPRKKL